METELNDQDEGRIDPAETEASRAGGISEFVREEEEMDERFRVLQAEREALIADGVPASELVEPVVLDGEFVPTMAESLGSAVDEHARRKALPLCTGVFDYFPDALLAVAELSRIGNDQHNPGEPLHWAKGKSTDHSDSLARHLLERNTIDVDGVRHSTKVAWRALAFLQTQIEDERNATPVNIYGTEEDQVFRVQVQLPADDSLDGFVWMQQGSDRGNVEQARAVAQALRDDGYELRVIRIVRSQERVLEFADGRVESDGTIDEVVQTVFPGDPELS